MMDPLVVMAIGQVVAIGVGIGLSLLFRSKSANPQTTLAEFLGILSKDFVNKVEEVIRVSFFENHFDNIKARILTANETYKRYLAIQSSATPEGAEAVLNLAKHDIDHAYAQFIVQVKKILAAKNNPPANITSYLELVSISILALQALSSVDISISSAYADIHPEYKEILLQRLEANKNYVSKLFTTFSKHQHLRVVAKELRLYWPASFESEADQFQDVYPKKDLMKSNSNYWVYVIDGKKEVSVKGAKMPTDYVSYDVYYDDGIKDSGISLQVPARKARLEPQYAKDELVSFVTRDIVEGAKNNKDEIVKIWDKMIEDIKYYDIYNKLVLTVEDQDVEIDEANLPRINKLFAQINQEDKNKLLVRSVRLAKIDLARLFLAGGGSVHAQDKTAKVNHEGLLHLAVKAGNVELTTLILSAGSDIDKKNGQAKTVVDIANATKRNDLIALIQQEKFNRFIESYPNQVGLDNYYYPEYFKFVNFDYQSPSTGDTLMHAALRKGDKRLVNFLIEEGVSIYLANKRGETAESIIRTLNQVDFPNILEKIFLRTARKGNIISLEKLLASGVDVNAQDPETGNSALHNIYNWSGASLPGSKATIEFLIQHGINVFALNAAGKTAAEMTKDAKENTAMIVQYIAAIREGQLVNLRAIGLDNLRAYKDPLTDDGILHEIARSQLPDAVAGKLIEDICLIPNPLTGQFNVTYIFGQNRHGDTAKDIALSLNRLDVIAMIDKVQNKALFQGIIYHQHDLIKKYIQDRGDVNAIVQASHPLHFLVDMVSRARTQIDLDNSLASLELFVKHNSDIYAQDANGRNVMDIIRRRLNSWLNYSFLMNDNARFIQALDIVKKSPMLQSASLTESISDLCLVGANVTAANITLRRVVILALTAWMISSARDRDEQGNFLSPIHFLTSAIFLAAYIYILVKNEKNPLDQSRPISFIRENR